jgi:hypothetical protein
MTGFALVAGFVIGAFAGLWIGRRREYVPTTEEKLHRKVYRHVDEIIGATKNENQIRADMRFRMEHPRFHLLKPWKNWRLLMPRKLRHWIADYFWPIPRRGDGTNPLPSDKRIAQYVWCSPDHRTWTVHYAAEAPANHAPFIEWLTKGRPVQGGGLAQALGLEWHPDLFEVKRNWSAGLVHLTLAGPAQERPTSVPVGVNADA